MGNSGFGLRIENFVSRGVFAHGSIAFASILAATIIVGGMAETCPVYAQEVVAEDSAASEQEAEAEKVRPTIDLGIFNVKDFRPSQNETLKLSFTIHLALQNSVNESTVKQLERWQHRLRDQVIVAIRLSETIDFLEPNLNKFRRRISLRVNRVLKGLLVSEAMLTEFTFSTS